MAYACAEAISSDAKAGSRVLVRKHGAGEDTEGGGMKCIIIRRIPYGMTLKM